MRRLLPLAFSLPILIALGGGNAAPADSAAYQDTVRCYNAASIYAQQFVVADKQDAERAMMGYAHELLGRAYALGATLGKSPAAVKSDFRDEDSGYIHQFYAFDAQTMTLTPFGTGEIAHCNLDRVLQ